MKDLDSTPLPYGAGKTWHNRYVRAGILRDQGALYGIKIVLTLDNARALSGALSKCANHAEKYSRNNIEIDAHFGRGSKDKGFKLDVRVFRPEEKD